MWTEYLRRLMRRGLRGAKLVISDPPVGLKMAVKLLIGTTQRCRVHFMASALAHANKTQRALSAPPLPRSLSRTRPRPRTRSRAAAVKPDLEHKPTCP
ncbi:MAG: hypothetical protein C4K60_18645 [Ideonella sp. MAG2]|nr:MAG: hypothetical protein C4K60_18645 [Ideonella sp. MAG2]